MKLLYRDNNRLCLSNIPDHLYWSITISEDATSMPVLILQYAAEKSQVLVDGGNLMNRFDNLHKEDVKYLLLQIIHQIYAWYHEDNSIMLDLESITDKVIQDMRLYPRQKEDMLIIPRNMAMLPDRKLVEDLIRQAVRDRIGEDAASDFVLDLCDAENLIIHFHAEFCDDIIRKYLIPKIKVLIFEEYGLSPAVTIVAEE